jgi:hypothetical protein
MDGSHGRLSDACLGSLPIACNGTGADQQVDPVA